MRLVLLLGSLLAGLRLLRVVLLQRAALATVGEPGILTDTWIILPDLLKSVLCGFRGFGAGSFLNFAEDFRAFNGYFLAEGRTIELKKTFDFVVGVVLIVEGDQFFVHAVDVVAFFVLVDGGVHEGLTLIVVGHSGKKLFAILFRGLTDGILNLVACPYEFEEGANVGVFQGIDGGLGEILRICGRLCGGLHGAWRPALNGYEKHADIDYD